MASPGEELSDGPAVETGTGTGNWWLVVGLTLLVLVLERGEHWGWLSWQTLSGIALGLAALALLVRSEWKADDPLVPLHLLRRDGFALHLSTLCLMQAVIVGVLTFAPIYFQHMMALDRTTTGLVMLAFVIGWAGMVPVAGWLYDRAGPDRPKLAGAALALAGLAWWGWLLPGKDLAMLSPAMLLSGIGVGLWILPANTAALRTAPVAGHAAAVGLSQTIRQSGGIVAVAPLGGLFLGAGSAGVAGAVVSAQAGFYILAAAALNLLAALSCLLPSGRGGARRRSG